jgi:hypothetical protein
MQSDPPVQSQCLPEIRELRKLDAWKSGSEPRPAANGLPGQQTTFWAT